MPGTSLPARFKSSSPTRVVFTHRAALVVLTFLLLHSSLATWSSHGQQIIDLVYQIQEELDTGSFVGNILHDSSLSESFPADVIQVLQFRFLKHLYVNKFILDERSGVLRTGDRIDRDTLCPNADVCVLKLDVAVQPAQYFHVIRVTINITDINDNTPSFPDSELVFDVLETAHTGTGLVIPSAVDPDSTRLSIHRYKIIKDPDVSFDLKEFRKHDGSMELRLLLSKPLDRELVDRYRMKVEATDAGIPPRTGVVLITINVVDVNDNNPVFERDSYDVTIGENTPRQTNILTVRAIDRDSGLNGQVVYELSSLTATQHGHLFGVRNATGEIYVIGVIDYEELDLYRLVIVARDLGPDSMPGTVTVTVYVVDYNDNAPEIVVDTLSSVAGVAEASESADIGTFVAHVSISDRDSGANGRFNCTLNDPHFSLEKLYGTVYKVTTAAVLDREERDRYNVAITCTDFGDDPQASVEHFTVRVTDVNDHSPVFRVTSYSGDVIENNYVGMIVLTVNATDADIGQNAELDYSLIGEHASSFQIDRLTGALKAMVSFDHETVQRAELIVVARDRGKPSRSASATAIVNIIDVNDERPKFTQATYTFRVLENEGPGTKVGVVTAHDADSGPHGQVSYSLHYSADGEESFRIDEQTGTVSTTLPLDREKQPTHTLTVVASDLAMPPLTSTATLIVIVNDTNDNRPEFPSSLRLNNTFHVSTLSLRGHVVTQQRAVDHDSGINAAVSHELYADRRYAADLFSVDSELGTIRVAGDLQDLDGDVIELKLMARDGGSPSQSSTVYINVNVSSAVPFTADTEHSLQRMDSSSAHQNLAIVISVAVVSSIITVCLVTAIVLLRRQDRRRGPKGGCAVAHGCRMEGVQVISSGSKGDPGGKRRGSLEGYDEIVDGKKMKRMKDCCSTLPNGDGCLAGNDHCRYITPAYNYQQKQPIIYGVTSTFSARPYSTEASYDCRQPPSRSSSSSGGVQPVMQTNLYQTDPAASQYHRNRFSPVVPQKHNANGELEAHRLLHQIKTSEADGSSSHSADGSNTDSGQGASETETAVAAQHTGLMQINAGHPAHSYPLTAVPEDSCCTTTSALGNHSNNYHGYTNQRYMATQPRSHQDWTRCRPCQDHPDRGDGHHPPDCLPHGGYSSPPPPAALLTNCKLPGDNDVTIVGDGWGGLQRYDDGRGLAMRTVTFAPSVEVNSNRSSPRVASTMSSAAATCPAPCRYNDEHISLLHGNQYVAMQQGACEPGAEQLAFKGVRLSTV